MVSQVQSLNLLQGIPPCHFRGPHGGILPKATKTVAFGTMPKMALRKPLSAHATAHVKTLTPDPGVNLLL